MHGITKVRFRSRTRRRISKKIHHPALRLSTSRSSRFPSIHNTIYLNRKNYTKPNRRQEQTTAAQGGIFLSLRHPPEAVWFVHSGKTACVCTCRRNVACMPSKLRKEHENGSAHLIPSQFIHA